MFEKVLYPTDFSDVSKKALAYLKSIKNAGAKQVIILRVINDKRVDCISKGIALAGEVSVIVLGSHGRSNLSDMLLGSVSDHVIRHSKKPVLVIKRD